MPHQILSYERNALFRSDHCFNLRPFPPQAVLRSFLGVFPHFFEIRINLRTFLRLQFNLRQARLVINRHGGLVFLRLQDVVNVNVIAEHGLRVLVAGEADERRLGQRIAHVPGEAVNEVVLVPVRFVGDDHDVAPVGEQRVLAAFFIGKEFLNGDEYYDAAGHIQQLAQQRTGRSASCW